MKAQKAKQSAHVDAMFRVKRGLCGYVSYLAACNMNEAFSEHVLYEPILRILTARGFKVFCEHECPGVKHPERGDKKRIDFYAKGISATLAIEVKWITPGKINIERDIEKLKGIQKAEPNTYPLLLLFGGQTEVEKIDLSKRGFAEAGKPVYANFRKTKYGCRVFRLKKIKKAKA